MDSIPLVAEDWTRPLLRTVSVLHGSTLCTLSDVRTQILAMTPERQDLPAWRILTGLLMATVHCHADVTRITMALEMVLRHEQRLALAAPSEAA
jgi:hypothetical protein